MRADPDPDHERALSWLANKTSDEVKQSLSPESTKIVANTKIPEVLQFEKIVHAINDDCCDESVAVSSRSMEDTAGALLAT